MAYFSLFQKYNGLTLKKKSIHLIYNINKK